MFDILMTIGAIVLVVMLFSLAVFIHEFGHFLAARKLGMKVEAFSIGFGPAIWKKRIDGVEYRISWILFGGYVSLPQLDPAGMEKIQGKHDGEGDESGKEAEVSEPAEPVPDAPPWQRIVVAVAGPFGNVVLAVVLAVLLAVLPWPRFGELGTEVGSVIPETPAAATDIAPGEVIEAVNGHAVKSWFEMMTEIQIAGERAMELRVRAKDGAVRTVEVTPKKDAASGACYLGLSSVDKRQAGAFWMPARNPLEQLKWDAMSIVRVLKALVTPKESGKVAKSLGGPVMIATQLYTQVRSDFWDGLGFLRFICINLAILNLLPIPVLDGGHCMFALYEIIARRKPSRRLVEVVTNVFGYLFIALFVWLIWSDSSRIWRVKHAVAESAAAASAASEPPEVPAK